MGSELYWREAERLGQSALGKVGSEHEAALLQEPDTPEDLATVTVEETQLRSSD